MPGRNYQAASTNKHRFGFNGKETDPETDLQDYGMRIYNPGLGKFLSIDPLCKNFPWWTPYQFAGNTPIQAIDLDGLEVLLTPFEIAIPKPVFLPRPITFPVPPGEIVVPPAGTIPNEQTLGQPKVEAGPPKEIDWENGVPSTPEDLHEDWEETTDPRNKSGSRDFENNKTGERIRWDEGRNGKPGWEGKNHWHRLNPNSKTKMDEYLDNKGNPVPRGSDPSHIEAPKSVELGEITVVGQKTPTSEKPPSLGVRILSALIRVFQVWRDISLPRDPESKEDNAHYD